MLDFSTWRRTRAAISKLSVQSPGWPSQFHDRFSKLTKAAFSSPRLKSWRRDGKAVAVVHSSGGVQHLTVRADVNTASPITVEIYALAKPQLFFLVLPNNFAETFCGAQTCCSVVTIVGDARIGVMQNCAAKIGVVAGVGGGGGGRRGAK